MRIVLISSEYPGTPTMGGIGTNTAAVAAGLARRGHDVHVVTKGDGGRQRDGDVTLWRTRPRRRLTRLIMSIRALVLRPDVVHAAEFGADAWWIARFARIPVVTRLATPTYLVDLLNHRVPTVRSRFIDFLERDQVRRSVAVYAPSRAISDVVAHDWRLPPERTEYIPNPLDIEAVRRAGATPIDIPLPERYIAFSGGFERRKGLLDLGVAAREVLRADPDMHLVCVGRPGDPEVLETFRRSLAGVGDRVHVLGELPRDQALSVVAGSAVAVCPSRWESFGYTCLEALTLGRPVVATRAGAFVEIVEDGVTGFLVPVENPTALAAALTRVLHEPGLAARLAEAGKIRAKAFDVENVVDDIVALFERSTASRNRSFTSSVYRRDYRRHFDPEGKGDVFRELYARKRAAVLERLALRPRTRLVDAGGGYGRFAEVLESSHDVTLCDLSESMVKEAHHRLLATRVEQADAMALPHPDGTFGIALAMDLAVHLIDLEAGLRELARVVRPGGDLVVDTTNANAWWVLAYPRYWAWRPDRLVRTLAARGVAPAWRHTVHHQHAHEFRRIAAAVGLEVVDMTPIGPGWCAKWHVWWLRKPS